MLALAAIVAWETSTAIGWHPAPGAGVGLRIHFIHGDVEASTHAAIAIEYGPRPSTAHVLHDRLGLPAPHEPSSPVTVAPATTVAAASVRRTDEARPTW
ncbi:hypothetical protein ACWGKW_19735 [Streptomyces sp. NPDC054766]